MQEIKAKLEKLEKFAQDQYAQDKTDAPVGEIKYAITLIEKEMPKDIKINEQMGYAECPVCDSEVEPDNYCHHCGQRLNITEDMVNELFPGIHL